ncbi:hypothetical protein [Paludibacterium purpuratum]|uniref:Uncharacterized protein n=1 Tax=Paludibacterium purpuratum TaxID=1144873 RepID=A0A4R7B895_9NEIS|nr:hypothetical protein [Paludibacterium purpuratum]TDR80005.1 hypothetical protein DFP86_106145 [Paludibacterium purpuratum]
MENQPAPIALIVKHAFADYRIGDKIDDPQQVDAILAGENAGQVLKVLN